MRRAFLLGTDEVTGRNLDHRKTWIENRLVFLTDVFAMDLTGFTVMSNHYHAVVRTEPERVAAWSDEEVADRWLKLSAKASSARLAKRRAALLASPEELTELRERLGSLSWYMKYINEPIARMSNKEDGATGRFWEGRFHSEALLDQAAITAAMAYVDLNPYRAGMVDNPTSAEHTALARRLDHVASGEDNLTPLTTLGLTLAGYLDLLRWTVEREPMAPLPEALRRLRCQPLDWFQRFEAHRKRCRARGSRQQLKAHANALGQRWVWGVGDAPKT